MKELGAFAAGLFVALIFSGSASKAAAITYDETTDGDLTSNLLEPTPLGDLPAGDNAVSGSLAGEDIGDVFSFVVDSTLEVTELFFTFSAESFDLGAGFFLRTSDNVVLLDFNTDASGVTSGEDVLALSFDDNGALGPLRAGEYTIQLAGAGSRNGLDSYSLQLVAKETAVAPIPLPAGLSLLAPTMLALFALAGLRSRRQSISGV